MGDDKIRITRGDVHSADVDARLKRQEALNRTQQHVEQRAPAAAPTHRPNTPQTTSGWSWFYNPLVYMALFGLVGGFFAWAFGEFPMSGLHDRDYTELNHYLHEQSLIQRKIDKGTLSQSAGNDAIKELQDKYKRNAYIAFWREHEQDAQRDKGLEQKLERAKTKQSVENFLFYTLVGTFLALFLGLAEPAVCRNVNGAVINGTIGAMLGLCGGVVLWLFVDAIYTAMGGGDLDSSFVRQMAARAIGWGLIGLFMALAPGIVLRSFKRCGIGLAGGLIGGLLGGLLFDPVYLVTKSDVVCRFVAICAIGGFVGAGTGILENAAKTGWLMVTAGLIAGKQFILYRNPTVIGSSPQCEIFLFKDAAVRPRHAQIAVTPAGFDLEDLGSETGTIVNGSPVSRVRLRSGDQVQIGATSFVFHQKVKTS